MKDGGGGSVVSRSYFPQYVEAIGRSFYRWCNEYKDDCSDGTDAASVLNYLSHYSESAKGVVDNPGEAAQPRDWNLSLMKDAIGALQGENYRQGCAGNQPCDWGDLTLWADDPAKQAAARGHPWFLVFDQQKFFIESYCQTLYWGEGYWQPGRNADYIHDYYLCPKPGDPPPSS